MQGWQNILKGVQKVGLLPNLQISALTLRPATFLSTATAPLSRYLLGSVAPFLIIAITE